MAEKAKTTDVDSSEEARHLAEEAMDEMKHGNKEEANFVLNEARAIDRKTADEVVKSRRLAKKAVLF